MSWQSKRNQLEIKKFNHQFMSVEVLCVIRSSTQRHSYYLNFARSSDTLIRTMISSANVSNTATFELRSEWELMAKIRSAAIDEAALQYWWNGPSWSYQWQSNGSCCRYNLSDLCSVCPTGGRATAATVTWSTPASINSWMQWTQWSTGPQAVQISTPSREKSRW